MDEITKNNMKRIKVNLPGGFAPVGDMLELLELLLDTGVTEARIGVRQQLYFSVDERQLEDLKYELFNLELPIEIENEEYPNIMSSYVADGIFTQHGWVREGIYKDIVTSFDFEPKLKVNIVADTQSFVPFYTGNLNFISSRINNYWHVYIRWPKTNAIYNLTKLIYSLDIAPLCHLIESLLVIYPFDPSIDEDVQGAILEEHIVARNTFSMQEKTDELTEPEFRLPYYEGFNKHDGRHWLGIFRPDEVYAISFLMDICEICQSTRVGQFYTTPWKSLIIKDISDEDRDAWDLLLDKHRINLRHASNELNWQTEDWCKEGLEIKRTIVNFFCRLNIRTYRLCFGVKINPSSGVWGSIIIKRNRALDGTTYFDVKYTADFNANSRILIPYRSDVSLKKLPKVLKKLCDQYYDSSILIRSRSLQDQPNKDVMTKNSGNEQLYYQCVHCLSIYDPMYGDGLSGVAPGIVFEDLPDDYCCGLCEAPKKEFQQIVLNSLKDVKS